jgi:hypothetical protein
MTATITQHAETVEYLFRQGWEDCRIGRFLGVKTSAITYVRRLLRLKRPAVSLDE